MKINQGLTNSLILIGSMIAVSVLAVTFSRNTKAPKAPPAIGKCYTVGGENRNPFEAMSYACVVDAQGDFLLITNKRFSEIRKEWICENRSFPISFLLYAFPVETAYTEKELCPSMDENS